MRITQDDVIETRRKHIGENGVINGFTQYAGHMCMVLVLPVAKDSVRHHEFDDVRDGLVDCLCEGDGAVINMEDVKLNDGRIAQIQVSITTDREEFVHPPTKKELKEMFTTGKKE